MAPKTEKESGGSRNKSLELERSEPEEKAEEEAPIKLVKRRFVRKAKALQPMIFDFLNVQTGIAASVIMDLVEKKQEEDMEKTRSALGVIFSIFRSLGFLRGICFFLVFLSFFFQIPVWCYEMGDNISKDCSIDQYRTQYFTTSLLTFEMHPAYYISWSCQAFLIANQIFSVIFATQKIYIARVIALVVCLVLDIVTGILFLNGALKLGINAYFKIAFIIIYSQTLRNGALKLLNTIKDSMPALLIYALNLAVFSGLANILFFDIPNYYDSDSYFTFSFRTFRHSMISLYALQTSANHPDIFLKIYPNQKIPSMFFVAYSFWTIFLIVNVVVSIMYITYKKYYSSTIKKIPNMDDYSRLMAAAYDQKRQILVLDDVAKMTKQYLNQGPEHLEFIMAKHFQSVYDSEQLDPIPPETDKRDTGYNLKHRPTFMAIFNSRFYQYSLCAMSVYITAAPLLILEDPRDQWQLSHYNIVEYICFVMMVDPLLVLIFIGPKKLLSGYFYTQEIFSSLTLIGLSVMSDCVAPERGQSLAQTNYVFFLIYSAVCFSKITRIFATVLNELPQVKAVFSVMANLKPFLSDMFGMMIVLFLIFGQFGINNFGGLVNSETPEIYLKKIGSPLPKDYHRVNFNDFPNSMVTLYNGFLKANWQQIANMFLVGSPSKVMRYYFIAFIVMTSLVLLNLVIGFIVEVILTHLNKKYSKFIRIDEAMLQQIKASEEFDDSSEENVDDEDVYVDDEKESDLEAKILSVAADVNKGIKKNMKVLGVEEKRLDRKAHEHMSKMPMI